MITSARRSVAFFADFFFAGDFFFGNDFVFAASLFGTALLTVFFLAEGALLAADFFRVGFFLLTVFFLRAGFFLAIGKVYQIFLPLRSNPPAARFRDDIHLRSMQCGSARERPRHLPFLLTGNPQAHVLFSTITTSRMGPCAPCTRIFSMSAVRLEPLITQA